MEMGNGSASLSYLANAAELYAEWDALSLEERQEIQGSSKDGWGGFNNPFPMSQATRLNGASPLLSNLPAEAVTIPLYRGSAGVQDSFVEVELPNGSTHLFQLSFGQDTSVVSPAFAKAAEAKVSTRTLQHSGSTADVATIATIKLGETAITNLPVTVGPPPTSESTLPVSGMLSLRQLSSGLAFASLPSQGVLAIGPAELGPDLLALVKDGVHTGYASETWSKKEDGKTRKWVVGNHPWLFEATINDTETVLMLGDGAGVSLSRNITENWTPAWSQGITGMHSVHLEFGGDAEAGTAGIAMDVLANESATFTHNALPADGYISANWFDIAVDPSTSTMAVAEAHGTEWKSWWDTALANALDEGDKDEEGEQGAASEEDASEDEENAAEETRRPQDGSCHKATAALSVAHLFTDQADRVMKLSYTQESMDYMVPLVVGNAMVAAGKASEAEPAYRQAMQINKAKGSIGLGLSLYAQGKGTQATEVFKKNVLANPDNLQLANLYAESMALSQGMGAAIEAMAVLAASSPQNATWALAVARTLAMAETDATKALNHAIGLFEKGVARNPTGEVVGQYALSLVLAERYEEATIMADAALKVQANSPSALLALARMAANEGQMDFANQLRKRAAFSNFSNPAYAALLKP